MDLTVYIQLIFLCVVNIIFTFSGIVSNALVMVSIWKSPQLRKKSCHFMILVLSCCDLVAVVTNSLGILVFLISWIKEDYDLLPTWWLYLDSVAVFFAFSLLALLVMSIERYLGAFHPVLHRRSVTRCRLLIILAILLIFTIALQVMPTNNMIISKPFSLIIFVVVVFLPLVYLNFKLFKFSRQVRRRKAILPEKKTTVNIKSISTCLLVVASLVVLSIPTSVFIIFNHNAENKQFSNTRLSAMWSTTFYIMNCTFNSLIFFWKNKVLRREGIKPRS